MDITWHKKGTFTVKTSGGSFLFNPLKGISSKGPFTGVFTNSAVRDEYDEKVLDENFVIDWPGEYELQGVLIEGLEVQHDLGTVHSVFTLTSKEGLTLCHVGEFPGKLSNQHIDKLGIVDVLIVPIKETEDRKLKDVQDLIDSVEPEFVIPAYYDDPSELEAFAKNIGGLPDETLSKFKVNKSSITGNGPKLVLLAQK